MKYQKIPSVLGVVLGIKNFGKSYFVKKYLIPKFKKKKPVVVLDLTGEYKAEFPGKNYRDFPEFYECCKNAGGIVQGVHTVAWTRTGKNGTAVRLIKFIRKMEVPVTLVLEEAHVLFNTSMINRNVKESLNEVCFLGAHYGIDTILCAQRAASLSTNVRSQADFFVTFKQKEAADLNYLRQKQEAPPETAETVAKLQKKQFFSIGTAPDGFNEIKINQVNEL